MKEKLDEAIKCRNKGDMEGAETILADLHHSHPLDPDVNYQLAWTYDAQGKESQAAPHYEIAIAYGLTEDRIGAMLGLGSTYRCLGEYQKSERILDQAVSEFPDNRAIKVFRALTQYNLGKHSQATEELLLQLLDTTTDSEIKRFDRPLRFYADKLDQTWT